MNSGSDQATWVTVQQADDVALLRLARAPTNAVSAPFCDMIGDHLRRAMDQAAIRAVVIASDLGVFSAGSDAVQALGKEREQDGPALLQALCGWISAAPKPIVVAIEGACLTAGLDLALAASGRVAGPDAIFGYPDGKFGLLPPAGGAYRLARRVGPEAALQMLLNGTKHTADMALKAGLVDVLAPAGKATQLAIDRARDLANTGGWAARRHLAKYNAQDIAAIAAAKARVGGLPAHLPAPKAMVAAVEAAFLLPESTTLAQEASAADALRFGPTSRALVYAFAAQERARAAALAASNAVDLPDVSNLPPLSQIHVWGAGAGLAQLCTSALAAGMMVWMLDPDAAQRAELARAVEARQAHQITAGRLGMAARDADLTRLRLQPSGGAAKDAAALRAVFCGQTLALPPPLWPRVDVAFAPQQTGQIAALEFGDALLELKPQADLARADAQSLRIAIAPTAPQELASLLSALLARLDWHQDIAAQNSQMGGQMRRAMTQIVTHFCEAGLTRPQVLGAMAAYGVAVPPDALLPPCPAGASDVMPALLAVWANIGAKMLRLGQAKEASAIDAAALAAGICPPWRGGPMYQADMRGPLVMRADLRARAARAITPAARALFDPDLAWDNMIAQGKNLAEYSAPNGV